MCELYVVQKIVLIKTNVENGCGNVTMLIL